VHFSLQPFFTYAHWESGYSNIQINQTVELELKIFSHTTALNTHKITKVEAIPLGSTKYICDFECRLATVLRSPNISAKVVFMLLFI
jgi:hypothetical protein